MNNRTFIAAIAVIVIFSFVAIAKSYNKNNQTQPSRLGVAQAEEKNASRHISAGQRVSYSQAIPTSGPHGQEASWGYSAQQLPNKNIIHNMEHGGIVVSYRPDLDTATVQKLVKLFTKPYADPQFIPGKAIVMPRAGQKQSIVLASWNRLLKLNNYDQKTLENYYWTNEGKSPEPRGI